MARHTPEVHQKVKRSVVGIAGLGGLGSNIAIALACVGMGTLILVDFDVVEPSNLNRQQYFIQQIGMTKVEALQENISPINPSVRILPYREKLDRNNVARIFKEADVVVEAFDRADEKAMLINTVSEKMPDKYLVAASGVAGYGDHNEIKTVRFSAYSILLLAICHLLNYYSSLTKAISSQSGNLTHLRQSVQILWGSTALSTFVKPSLSKNSDS